VIRFCWSPELWTSISINSKVSFLDHVNHFSYQKYFIQKSLSLLKSHRFFYFFLSQKVNCCLQTVNKIVKWLVISRLVSKTEICWHFAADECFRSNEIL
jgi:hypothetical protein